jgi:acetyl-CoA acetyltransferase
VTLKPESGFERGNRELVDTTIGWRFVNPRLDAKFPTISLGETAERVATKWNVSREDQDAFALESQRRAAAAAASGVHAEEIVPVSIPQRKGEPIVVDKDEHPRPDTDAASLAKLRPAFVEGGSVTAGNASTMAQPLSLWWSRNAHAHSDSRRSLAWLRPRWRASIPP